jgi:hypothetical protein
MHTGGTSRGGACARRGGCAAESVLGRGGEEGECGGGGVKAGVECRVVVCVLWVEMLTFVSVGGE